VLLKTLDVPIRVLGELLLKPLQALATLVARTKSGVLSMTEWSAFLAGTIR
jgi:hypothetical protein